MDFWFCPVSTPIKAEALPCPRAKSLWFGPVAKPNFQNPSFLESENPVPRNEGLSHSFFHVLAGVGCPSEAACGACFVPEYVTTAS